MTTEFTQFNLLPELEQAIVELGYVTPTPIQSALIPVMMTGRDVIGQAQTGTGKTAAFALPILQNLERNQNHIQALIVAPTRELALQVHDATVDYGKHINVRVLAVYGGQAYGPQIGQLKRGVDIVVGTPGRLLDLIKRDVLDLSHVRTVVLDEADEMLSMGFIEDIESLLAVTPTERQTALFSATMPTEIRRLAERYLRQPEQVTIRPEKVTVETISQRCYMVHRDEKVAALTRLFEIEEITSALIFVRTRTETGELANELTVRGFPAEALSGDLSQDARERVLLRFRQNQIKVLVATDVAARGLDIEDISHVFNVGLPDDPEIYVHRIGRTGRAGKTGVAISLFSPSEKRRLAQIEAFTRQKIQRAVVPTEDDIRNHREETLIKQVAMWLQRGRCRKEREIVEKLILEGNDPIEIAAAALKVARAEEKQRPIDPVTELADRRSGPRSEERPARGGERGERSERPYRSGAGSHAYPQSSHEPGMVRLSLDAGRKDGIRPNDIVGAIAFHADIPGSVIGKIRIQENNTWVDVPEEYVTKVLAKTGEVRIRRQPIAVALA